MNKRRNVIVASVCAMGIMFVAGQASFKANASTVNSEYVSTEVLMDKVLENTDLTDVYAYNSSKLAIEALANECEDIKDLLEREDLVSVVISKYEDMKLSEDYSTSDTVFDSLTNTSEEDLDDRISELLEDESINDSVKEDASELSRVYFLECIMTSKDFVLGATADEQKELKEVAYNKYLQKEESAMYEGLESDIYELAIESDTASEYDVTVTREGTAAIRTPNGSTVYVMVMDYEGDKWAQMTTMQFKRDYPQAKVLAYADNRYNCHSYAWYKSDTSNRYWLNDPSRFITDGSFVMTSKISTGNKVTWADIKGNSLRFIEHSGIVVGKKGNNVVIESKWGQGPLMRHTDTYSPYENPVYYFTKNK